MSETRPPTTRARHNTMSWTDRRPYKGIALDLSDRLVLESKQCLFPLENFATTIAAQARDLKRKDGLAPDTSVEFWVSDPARVGGWGPARFQNSTQRSRPIKVERQRAACHQHQSGVTFRVGLSPPQQAEGLTNCRRRPRRVQLRCGTERSLREGSEVRGREELRACEDGGRSRPIDRRTSGSGSEQREERERWIGRFLLQILGEIRSVGKAASSGREGEGEKSADGEWESEDE